MIVLNFSHPLTPDHLAQVEALTGQKVERVVEAPAQVDLNKPLVPQVVALADQTGLSPVEWQTLPILINPPGLSSIAVVLLAELHGRMGYFPPSIRLRRMVDSLPPRYEVAEVLDLQAVRDTARKKRL